MIKSKNLDGFKKLLTEYYTECANCETYPNVKSINEKWERYQRDNEVWISVNTESVWAGVAYGIRHKKKTVNINGFDVVSPILDRLPKIGQIYWHFNPNYKYHVTNFYFDGDEDDERILRLGWHETEEDAKAYWNARFADIKTNYGDENE